MSLLMPGQWTHCLALYLYFDICRCPLWSNRNSNCFSMCDKSILYSECITLSMMWSLCFWNIILTLYGQPAVITLARPYGKGSCELLVYFFLSRCHWQQCMRESLMYHWVNVSIRYLWPFTLLGDAWLWNHNPEPIARSSVEIPGHLPGSSWKSVVVTCHVIHQQESQLGSCRAVFLVVSCDFLWYLIYDVFWCLGILWCPVASCCVLVIVSSGILYVVRHCKTP